MVLCQRVEPGLPDQKDEWHQGRSRRTDPVGQRRDIEIDTVAVNAKLASFRKFILSAARRCRRPGRLR